jgi:hypothetical protein
MNTDTDAVQMPPMPSNVSHVMRRIRRCESETAAQLVLEHFAMEYARALLASNSAESADAWVIFGNGEIIEAVIDMPDIENSGPWTPMRRIKSKASPTAPAQSCGDAEQADEAVTDDVFDWLETEVTAISCRYHGDPSYDHDAYWMRDRVVKLIGEARNTFAARAKDSK